MGGSPMNAPPRFAGDYTTRQVEAARRVLVDVGQVLASFEDAIVVVGGWVPDLLFPAGPTSAHIGSIDVDLALDAAKLDGGRYAELLKLLLDTGRYKKGEKAFQWMILVDLNDGERPIRVDVEFLAPSDVKLKKNRPKLLGDFRVLQFSACAAAFTRPETVELAGAMVSGVENTVHLRVASLPDFLIMKAHAIGGRDKPKDVYDLCYCLDEFPDAIEVVAANWRTRRQHAIVAASIGILKEKFQSVSHYGPQQLATFHSGGSDDDKLVHARRAFELVQKLLSLLAA
jgi:hypothetical protein